MKYIIIIFILFPCYLGAQINNDSINKVKIEALSNKLDSVTNRFEYYKLNYEVKEQHEVIDKVHGYYDSAWNKLVVLLGIISIVGPIIIQLIQQKNFKNEANNLYQKLSLNFDDKLKIIKEENEKETKKLESLFKLKSEELEKIKLTTKVQLDSYSFLMAGNLQTTLGRFLEAARLYSVAANNWMGIEDYNNLHVALNHLLEIINKVPDNEFKQMEKDLQQSLKGDSGLNNLILRIRERNLLSRFSIHVKAIEEKLQ